MTQLAGTNSAVFLYYLLNVQVKGKYRYNPNPRRVPLMTQSSKCQNANAELSPIARFRVCCHCKKESVHRTQM
jgi:hypothetical protein